MSTKAVIYTSYMARISTQELTEKITSNFHDDCNYLSCEKPSHEPKATENISLMIDMINILLKKGNAYKNNSNIYFDVSTFKDYGKLSNKNIDELLAGARAVSYTHLTLPTSDLV